MQFKKNTSYIPDELVQAHEEGHVVFFCGAGISYPAGLPGFKELVDAIYEKKGDTKDELEKEAYDKNQFDTVLDLLEKRITGGRKTVREALLESLKPDLEKKGAIDTHKALLQLGRSRDNSLRLVTTNFDRLFKYAARDINQEYTSYEAPMLPIPKKTRWNGVVYLHGLLPDKPDETVLNQLVVTSGDFGLAYLTERWAARFVSNLIHNFVVCFVGYSINDPILRYMMDALAADRMMGETTLRAYAFGAFQPENEVGSFKEWKAKGVTPIFYPSNNHHRALHETLQAWAKVWEDGTLGKERIIVENAYSAPSKSTRQDDFVSRMKWALSDPSSRPAKCFAELNPPPLLEWLDAFAEDGYHWNHLSRFGITPFEKKDEKLNFSLIHRPTPFTLTPWMSLVSSGDQESQWDDIMFHIARWLTQHLNDPNLLFWLAQEGGQLHSRLHSLINQKLEEFSDLEQKKQLEKLDVIKANPPNAIPEHSMSILWRLLLTGRVASQKRKSNIYTWKKHLKRYGLTTTLRLKLRELLAPKLHLQRPFPWGNHNKTHDRPKRIRELVDWKIILTNGNTRRSLLNCSDECWQKALPELLEDFEQLLLDALDLQSELGEADELNDLSYLVLPSVSLHKQNRRSYQEWGILIELLRDAWIALSKQNKQRATQIAQGWFYIRYPTFKRLALFAASQNDVIAPDTWVQWLIADEGLLLWKVNTKRETLRLLVLKGSKLTENGKRQLETAILKGPPEKNQADTTEKERSIWLRLAKLQSSGVVLGPKAQKQMKKLQQSHPKWRLSENERDEFSFWISSSSDPDYEDNRKVILAPRNWQKLAEWLEQSPPQDDDFYQDNWREICRAHLYRSIYALCHLSQNDVWPAQRWKDALGIWSQKDLIQKSWRSAAPIVEKMPDKELMEIIHQVSFWIEASSKVIDRHEMILIQLCHRILELNQQEAVDTENPVLNAINHPIGHATQALLNVCFKRKLSNGEKLPSDIEPLFTTLCDKKVPVYRYARTLLTSRLIALFLVDPAWTETNLLPYFSWEDDSIEAKSVWQGFLWSPRLYPPLLLALKSPFLETSFKFMELNEFGEQYAVLLTYAALNQVDDFTEDEFRSAFESLPIEGLEYAAQTLVNALKGAGKQYKAYWKKRIEPFWQCHWPKSNDKITQAISESFSELCIHTGDEFPSALIKLKDWLQPIPYSTFIIEQLHDSALCQKFPAEVLEFLNRIINGQPFLPAHLNECLYTISEKSPELIEDSRFKRLIADAD